MKKLILLALVLIPFSLIAQIEVENRKISMNDQNDQWMTKISSDSEMRIKMMDMMIAKTKDDEGEMKKLVNSILADPGMNKMIFATNSGKARSEDISIEPLGIVKEDIKVGKMNDAQPVPNKK